MANDQNLLNVGEAPHFIRSYRDRNIQTAQRRATRTFGNKFQHYSSYLDNAI